MPGRKGRRRKQQRARRDSTSGPPSDAPAASDGGRPATSPRETSAVDLTIPALRVRYAAFIVAVLTLMIGVLTAAQAVAGDHGTPETIALTVTGVALALLGLTMGTLALVPARIAAWLRRAQ